MSGYSESRNTICLLNENAQCNPIWVSQADGLHLAHFQTFQPEMSMKEHAPVEVAYEKCARHCLIGDRHL